VAPGQAAVPHRREEPASYPAGRDRQKTQPLAGPRRSSDSRLPSGYALLSSRIRRHFLILIDARFSSRLSRSSFDPKTEKFDLFPLPDRYAGVRALAGRKGEVWGAESGADKLFVLKTE